MKKAVIFDMDGVLVDNADVHVEAFEMFCKSKNVDISGEKLRSYFGMGNEDIFRELWGSDLTIEQINDFAAQKEAIYREIYAHTIKPVEGLVEIMKAIKASGAKIAIGSSGITANVQFVIEKCGLSPYIDAIANGDMITKAKPDPEVFLLAARLLDIEPTECVVFEDSFAGVAAARSAGMKVIALTTTYPRESHKDYDFLIDDFTQISIEQILS
ncbi:MAG: HAD family phosphatase [Rikenellaceae bacterium]